MPLFKSLRSKSSRKSSASVSSEVDNASDFGPRSASSTTYDSIRSTKNGGSVKPSDSKTSLAKLPLTPSSPPRTLPRYQSSTSIRAAKSALVDEGEKTQTNLMETLPEVNSSPASTFDPAMNKTRPSDLFAGKGVQWDAVKLAGPQASPATAAKTNTNEDMQNFLKMRRQWKPTFATENEDINTANFQPPKDLSQLTFASGDKIQSQGLMSLKDLDESHQRKQHLLSSAPLGGSLWDEPETSEAAIKRASNNEVNQKGKPVATRKESSKGRKFLGGEEKVTSPAPQVATSKPTPTDYFEQGKTSKVIASDTKEGVSTPMPPGGFAAPTVDETVQSTPAAVRTSIESSGNGFETPTESSAEMLDATKDDDKTLTSNGNGHSEEKVATVEEKVKHMTVDTVAIPENGSANVDPFTPRPAVESLGNRSITPTPHNGE
ncbi:hypothetical protein CBS101457_001294 [Exobasidium rhododendri]|nr:hypothetical protein CBS101457_001294 [Exobasidium rhododendri]